MPFGRRRRHRVLARVFIDHLQQRMGQTFTAENRGGAGGQIAAAAFARAPADGYTLMFTTAAPITIAPLLSDKVQYDPRKDFVPIALVAVQPVWLTVNADSPFKTLADVVSHAKDHPGKLTYGTSGVGTELHLAAEAIARSAGIQMVHVPFRGGAEVITALMGRQVDLAALSTASIANPVRQGTLRALAVTVAAAAGRLSRRAEHRGARPSRRHHAAVVGHDGARGHAAFHRRAAHAGAAGGERGRRRARAVESDLRADRVRRTAGVLAPSRCRARAIRRHHPRRQDQAGLKRFPSY